MAGYPVRHKAKMPFRPMLILDLDSRSMMSEIYRMDRELGEFLLSADDYRELVEDAYASNIHWSTKIEGNRLTFEEVRELTELYSSGTLHESSNGPKQEILNHLFQMFSNRFSLPWTVETVKEVHSILLKDVEDLEPGIIRTKDVSVKGTDGMEYFIACPNEHVSTELESLIEWANTSPYPPVIASTLFFHEFESIHPFIDGNGRTGRTLFQMLLQEYGLPNCHLCKFEERLLSNKETYYDLLAFTDSTEIYTQLVSYVIDSLYEAYVEAVDLFGSRDRLAHYDENLKSLARKARSKKIFTLSEACEWSNASEQSIRSQLNVLVDDGVLRKEGKTRAMRYVFDDPFDGLRPMIEDLEKPCNT